MTFRISYAEEVERAAAALTLNGFCRGLLNDGSIPTSKREVFRHLIENVSKVHGIPPKIVVGDHTPETVKPERAA